MEFELLADSIKQINDKASSAAKKCCKSAVKSAHDIAQLGDWLLYS